MLTILGCGNLNRQDDAVGVQVVQRLQQRLARHPVPGVQAFDCGTAGIEVMFKARGSRALILVDASRTGSEPGAVYEVPGHELEQDHDPTYSLHDFRWDHALSAGRRIYGDEMPQDVTVFLIEARDLDLGLELSEPVAKAADIVYDRLLERIAAWSVARHETEQGMTLTVKRGSVQIPAEVYDTWLAPRAGVVPFEKDGRLCLLPVEEVAGGLLVKLRTARGDRAVDLTELLAAYDWDVWGTYTCEAAWEPTLGALALHPPRSTA